MVVISTVVAGNRTLGVFTPDWYHSMGHCFFNDRGCVPPRDTALQPAHAVRRRVSSRSRKRFPSQLNKVQVIVLTADDIGGHASTFGNTAHGYTIS